MAKHKHQWQSEHPPKYELVTDSANITGNGIHEVIVHILETRNDGTTVTGIPETLGIDPIALRLKHGNDIGQWREWTYGEMKERHIRRTTVHNEIIRWKGQRYSPKEKS